MAKKREDELKRADAVREARSAAATVFLDRELWTEDRLEAARSCGTFADDEVSQAWATFDDKSEDGRVRIAALHGLSQALDQDGSRVSAAIERLGDEDESAEVRAAVLTALQGQLFGSRRFAAHRPAYLNVLRKVIRDDDAHLRRSAMEYLSVLGDDYLTETLVRGLNDPAQALVEPEVAIQHLGQNLHTDAIPTIREVAATPPNPAARREALRNLATDADSAGLLADTLVDKTVEPLARHIAAVGLFQTDPAKAIGRARLVVADDDEDDELRTAMLNTLLHLGGTQHADKTFDDYVSKLADNSTNGELSRLAKRYVAYVERDAGE